MKKIIKRITACVLSSAFALSMLITPGMAAESNVISDQTQDGFVSLDQYITATSVPGVYEVSLAVGANLTPKPIDVIIVLDESDSMIAPLAGASGATRWDIAKEGANKAIDVFFNPDINGGYDMTRIAALSFGSTIPHSTRLMSPDAFLNYQDATSLKSNVNGWTQTPLNGTNMSLAMGTVDWMFDTAKSEHKLDAHPDLTQGSLSTQSGAPAAANRNYNQNIKKYVIFLSDGMDNSHTVGSAGDAMIDYVTKLKMPYTASNTAGQGVKFYTIGLALGSDDSSWNNNAPSSDSNSYRLWNTPGSFDENANEPAYASALTATLGLPATPTVNPWVTDVMNQLGGDPSNLLAVGNGGFAASKYFTRGYFDIPGDQYQGSEMLRPADQQTPLTVHNSADPAQTLIYTAMGIDFNKGNAQNYIFGNLAGAQGGDFLASPMDGQLMIVGSASGVTLTPISDSTSVLAKLNAASNSTAMGTANVLGYYGIPATGAVLSYYNKDTWDGRTPNFYMADTSAELTNTFEEIARSIVQFGKDIKTTATLNTDQFDLYTGFADAPQGYKTSGAAQNVSMSGGKLSWTMDAIPRNTPNRVTFYIQLKPGSYEDGLSYDIFKDLNIGYTDDQNFFNNGIAVDTYVNKKFPSAFVNPSSGAIKNNGVGPNGEIIQNNDGSDTMSSNGPVATNTNGNNQDNTMTGSISSSSNGKASDTTGSIILSGISGAGEDVKAYESSNKKIVITSDNAKMYQKTKAGKYKAVASLKKGNTFTVLSEDDSYYKVQYMKKDAKQASVGYISKKDAKQVTNNQTANIAATAAPTAATTDAASSSTK